MRLATSAAGALTICQDQSAPTCLTCTDASLEHCLIEPVCSVLQQHLPADLTLRQNATAVCSEPHCGLPQPLLPAEVILSCNTALQSQFGAFFSSPCQQTSVTIPSSTSEWTCGLKLSGTFSCSRKPPPALHIIHLHPQSFQYLLCLSLVQLCACRASLWLSAVARSSSKSW